MPGEGLHFIGTGGKGLEALAFDLRGAAASLVAETPAVLERVGHLIEYNAKAIAAANGSTSIPATITGSLHGPLEYRVRAGNENVAIAGLWELGNKGRGRSGLGQDWFVHPTFGKDPWVEQARYPFLRPALNKDRAAITAAMETLWDKALTPWRLRPSASSLAGSGTVSAVVGSLL